MDEVQISRLLAHFFKPHPWHGISPGPEAPERLRAYIEMVPTDYVKYEIDKENGHLKVDRPQRFSSLVPCLYGFVPRTYCGERVGRYCSQQTGLEGIEGDGDPLDICVFTERPITHADILVSCIPVGGLRLLDAGCADDKILAVLEEDAVFGGCRQLEDLPRGLLDRLEHYFLTYKDFPGQTPRVCQAALYGREEALEVVRLSLQDYSQRFQEPLEHWQRLLDRLGGP